MLKQPETITLSSGVITLGESAYVGTKTVFESESLAECYVILDELKIGKVRNNQVIGITKDELELATGFSILVQLSATYLAIQDFGCEMRAEAELRAYKVEKEL
mgnify:CR=1 FL=1